MVEVGAERPSRAPLVRKWYFSLSEASIDRKDHGWRGLTRVAVASALSNTSLQPVLLYDGEESSFTIELREMGVKVIQHRVSFYDKLVESAPKRTSDYLGIALGVFPRVEIPWIEEEDEFVLFTDCDVMFFANPTFDSFPEYFAAAPQTSKTDYENDMNAGVMLMNVPALRRDLPKFIDFICDHLGDGWPGCDQENYRRFYKGRWEHLPLALNWKPYWGFNSEAKIVHWHGPKPQLVRRLQADANLETVAVWKSLYERNADGYRSFLKLWDDFAVNTRREILGHLDVLSESGGAGWAICQDDPSEPVVLRLVIDGVLEKTVICDTPRSDIRAVYGIEAAGFSFPLPARLRDGLRHRVGFRDCAGFPVALKYNGVIAPYHLWNAPA